MTSQSALGIAVHAARTRSVVGKPVPHVIAIIVS